MTDLRRPIFDLAEQRLGEPLDAFLLARRASKVSFQSIALEIRDRTRVTVTAETVRQWCKLAEPEVRA